MVTAWPTLVGAPKKGGERAASKGGAARLGGEGVGFMVFGVGGVGAGGWRGGRRGGGGGGRWKRGRTGSRSFRGIFGNRECGPIGWTGRWNQGSGCSGRGRRPIFRGASATT